jgi:penicillin-binding protein 1B
MRRHQTAIFASVLTPVCLGFAVFGYAYWRYSRVIDKGMKDGPFADAVNVYGEPFVLTTGDPLNADDVESELHLAGYREGVDGQPGTFRMHNGVVDTVSTDGTRARIGVSANNIARIQVNGHAASSWTIGAPFLANLNASREKRRIVSFDQIPRVLVNAVSSAEDKHFFTHEGIDVPRIVKAAYVDLRSGRKQQGASTLTMQLVRDLYLEPDKRWKRKISEAMMTIHLEREWSKEKIFETYANEVYLGRQASYSIHGFAEGAQLYFGKRLVDITLPEAATLAGMVQRPSHFNPHRNPAATKERRDIVLSLMRANHYIDDAQYREAVETPLTVAGPQLKEDRYGASYFLDLVTDDLDEIPRDEIDNNGRNVESTIDLNLQRAATEAIHSGMAEVDKQLAAKYKETGVKAQAALIAMDPRTGEIRAVVGGRDYAASQLNRVLARRPPGSVFKPFVYAAAIDTAVEGGNRVLTPASTVDDSPATFWVGGKAYTPANFKNESYGTLTLRQALAKSDNVAAVKVAQMVGFDNVVAMARRAGLNNDIKATPSVALGTYVVTPLEMAGAYAAFANGGMWVRPHILQSQPSDAHQAMDPRVAYLMVNMLEEVLRSGTAAGVRSRGFNLPAAGKTGTSHDGWFAGFTSQLLCVVWVGFDNYEELDLEGAKSALPIWTEFMKKAAQFGRYRGATEFPGVSGTDTVKICNRSGKLAGDDCTNTRMEVFISGTEPQEACDVDLPEASPLPVSPVASEYALAPIVTPPTPPPPLATEGNGRVQP